MDSILTSIKQLLGFDESYTHFDPDIIMDINSVLLSITQFGIGPNVGFAISDKTAVWSDLLGTRKDIEAVKIYIYLKVRLMFDPPTSGFVIDAINRQISEIEWRLINQVELTSTT